MDGSLVSSVALFVIKSAEVNFLAHCVLVYMRKNFSMICTPAS